MNLSNLPPNIKLHLLSLLNSENKKEKFTQQKQQSFIQSSTQIKYYSNNIIDSLYKNGYSIIDNFLENSLAEDILEEFKTKLKFQQAGIGHGITRVEQKSHRGDLHCWLNNDNTPENIKIAIEKIKGIFKTLNQEYQFGLTRASIQAAIYPV